MCELCAVIIRYSRTVNIQSFLSTLKLYSIVYTFIGMFIWVIWACLRKLSKITAGQGDEKTFYLLSAVCMSVLIIPGAWFNYFLSSFISLFSIVSNIIFFIAVICAFFLLYRFLKARKVRFVSLFAITGVLFCIFSAAFGAMVIHWYYEHSGQDYIAENRQNAKADNVVIILIDALRADHLSCYGYKRDTTPIIDSLAAEGALFERNYAQSSHTFESVPSILMSLYPSTHNVRNFQNALPENFLTVFQILKKNGFATAVFSEHGSLSEIYGWNSARGVDMNYTMRSVSHRRISILSYMLIDKMPKLIDFMRDRKIDYLREVKSRREGVENVFARYIQDKQDTPFAVYIHLAAPHSPYNPLPPYENVYQKPLKEDKIEVQLLSRGFFPFEEGKKVSDAHLDNIIARYDEEILYTDQEQVKKIVDALENNGLLDKTIIVITADHGEVFYEHKQWEHENTLFSSVIHVPLVMRIPGMPFENKRISEVTE